MGKHNPVLTTLERKKNLNSILSLCGNSQSLPAFSHHFQNLCSYPLKVLFIKLFFLKIEILCLKVCYNVVSVSGVVCSMHKNKF